MYGTVVRTEQLTPHLVRVVLGGEGLDDFAEPTFADSYVNMFFLPPEAGYQPPFDTETVRDLPRHRRPYPRRISVRSWEPRRRELAVDIAVHGEVGYAGRWARHAAPGDRVQLRGPAGDFSPPTSAEAYLLVGDESALPAVAACLEAVPAGRPALALLEVDGPDDELALDSPGDLRVVYLHRDGHPVPTGLLVDALAATPLPPGRLSAFVHGEAESIRAVRRHLLERSLVDPALLSCSPYWRRGSTDEEWRSVKADWVRAMQADTA
ncbi:siderophore-interacting protein [uncultured Serinicoccus sp.]|uniref:siderophore-interacting protein n=1 Tax=uncultured Serinicoccus sp. TaxID=735514 RepID=UPI0026315957|nr:siderophore-interacting protein [uncultured Serinicoccus sp.]